MAKRLTDTDIWDEDWFIDLPNEYKLFFLYVKDKCDHSGMWRPNRRKFQMVVHGKTIHFQEFLDAVNKDDQGKVTKKRIIALDNGKWFLTRYINFQLGTIFRPKIGAHRGALKLLVTNGIHPKDVPGIDWLGLETVPFQDIINLVHAKTLYSLSLEDAGSMVTPKEKKMEIYPEKGKRNNLEKSEKPLTTSKGSFQLQHIYDTPFVNADLNSREFKGITENQFNEWKKFVDFVIENHYEELFVAQFVNPADFTRLVTERSFTEDKWHDTIGRLLGSGMKKEQNLYFRIPDFMRTKVTGKAPSSMNVGNANYGEQDKW